MLEYGGSWHYAAWNPYFEMPPKKILQASVGAGATGGSSSSTPQTPIARPPPPPIPPLGQSSSTAATPKTVLPEPIRPTRGASVPAHAAVEPPQEKPGRAGSTPPIASVAASSSCAGPAGPDGEDQTVTNPWANLNDEIVRLAELKNGQDLGNRKIRCSSYFNRVAGGRSGMMARYDLQFDPFAWSETFTYLLKLPDTKIRDAQIATMCYYACMEHYRVLMASAHPLLLYGVSYSMPGLAEVWTPTGLKAKHAARNKSGKGFAKMRDGDLLHVAGQLVLGEDFAC
jgi:hypothetical protein